MPAKMTPHQLAFWRELMAEFHPNELSEVKKGGGRPLTYVDARALANRLDDVCGPAGWTVEYRPTERGYTARMGIFAPGGDDDSYRWIYKEDGGGFEDMGMKNRETGEWETDIDNDEKSAYTNAFRRVAQNPFGIGRYLYKKGMPNFLFADGPTPPVAAARPAPPPPQQERVNRDHTRTDTTVSDREMEPSTTRPPAERTFDNFKIPRAGKSVFAWAKEMEKTFEIRLVDGMGNDGNELGVGTTFSDWSQESVNTIAMKVIRHIATLPSYKGQFDHLLKADDAPAARPPAANPGQGVNISDLRKSLMGKMQELVQKQIGRPGEAHELKAAFARIAAQSPNGEGKLGQEPGMLSQLGDVTWLRNMIAFVERQATATTIPGPGDVDDPDIPF